MAFRLVTRFLLPALVFLGLAATAINFLFLKGVTQSQVKEKLAIICASPLEVSSSPLRLAYTGHDEVDKTMCTVCSFFHALMGPSHLPLLAETLAGFSASLAFIFAEAARDQRPFFIAMPVVFGVLMQILSFGFIMPLYSLLFITAGTRVKSGTLSVKINQANAEALLFALLVGFVVPTVSMFLFEDATVTAIWQFFPIIMGFLGFAHRLIRSPSRHTESGYSTVQAMYALVFVASAAVHIRYVWPLFTETDALQHLFLPYVGSDDPALAPAVENIAEFFKWDFLLGVASTFVLLLSFAESLFQCIVITVWCIATTVVLGPGAAISSVLMWREEQLNKPVKTPREKVQ